MKKLLAALLLFWTIAAHSADIVPFTSDGCSAFPNGTPKNKTLWLNCCIRHDLAYWKGGTYQERLDADLALERCVAVAGEPKIAKLMLRGVRAGGSPHLPTPYRWGYGWPFGRAYRALTQDEWTQVQKQLDALQQMLQSTATELPTIDP